MINSVALQGRLTANIELKTSESGKAFCNFCIAVDSGRATYFPNCTAWEKTAEFLSKYFVKGNLIVIEGKIQTQNYETQSGERRKSTTILVNGVHFCEKRPKEDIPMPEPPPEYTSKHTYSAPSTPQISPASATSLSDLNEFQEIISDGDLPF